MNTLVKIGFGVATALAAMILPGGAQAAICQSTTDCTLLFSQLNSGITGSFGYVNIKLTGTNQATVNVVAQNGYSIITTGFPNGGGTNYSVAFNDTVSGTLSITNFSPASSSSPGFVSSNTKQYQMDGFGSFNNVAWTNNSQGGSGNKVTALSFIVAGVLPNSLTTVEQLVAPSSGGGSGTPYWAVDVIGPTGLTNLAGAFGTGGGTCANGATNFPICSLQTTTPEPMSMAMLGVGLLGLGATRLRRRAG